VARSSMAEHSPAPTPSRAVRGFVGHLLAALAAVAYALWALIPSHVWRAWGVDFLPQQYWAVAVPIYVAVIFFTFVFVIYPSLGLCATHTLDDVRCVLDEHSTFLPEGEPVAGRVCDLRPKDQLAIVRRYKKNTKSR